MEKQHDYITGISSYRKLVSLTNSKQEISISTLSLIVMGFAKLRLIVRTPNLVLWGALFFFHNTYCELIAGAIEI
jgi:hypothetical protein